MKVIKKTITTLFLLAVASLAFAGSGININAADAETLALELTGVGIKKAQAIVDYRIENGPFKSIEGLTAVKGIGDKVLQDNVERIVIENK